MFELRRVGMLLAAIALALAVGIASTASAATCSSDFDERTLVDNLRMPTGVAWTLDGGMLITEKSGQLEVVPKNSSVPQQIYDNGNRVNANWGPRSARRRRRLGLRVQPTTSTCSPPSARPVRRLR
jgi:hypothetical protein